MELLIVIYILVFMIFFLVMFSVFQIRTAGMKDVATVYKINERYTMVLATKRYAYPNGSYIRKNAIIPDIHIPSNANDFNVFPDKQLMGAIDVR